MKEIIIITIILVQGFEFLLKYLNYRNRNVSIPDNVKDVFDEESYTKQRAYEMENIKLSVYSGICSLIVTVAVLYTDFYAWLWSNSPFTANYYVQMWFMVSIVAVINMVISYIFSYIDDFVIEAKYGFNKTTQKTFIIDRVKDIIINRIIISLGLLTLFMFLHGVLENLFVPIFFSLVLVILLVMMFLGKFLIRVFNKLTPLEEGELRERINELSTSAGYPVEQIYVIDSSRRTSHMNAFFTGFGKMKTIGLSDTMIEKFTIEEILFVVAHEIGHAKKKHTLWMFVDNVVMMAILATLLHFTITMEVISIAFGFESLNIIFNFLICMILFAPLFILLKFPKNMISRKREYQADAYALKFADKQHCISALKKLCRDSYVNLTPHPFVVAIEHSHPPLSQRVEAISRE